VRSPLDEKERLLEPVFRREIRMVREAGFNDVYTFGSAGEGYAVTNSQFKRVVEVFRDEMRDPAARGMVCVIGLSTAVVVERMAIAYDLGFRRFQITLPCWGASTTPN